MQSLLGRHTELSLPLVWEGYLGATRNWCSLGAAFGGSFGMGRGLPNSPSAQTQQPFSCSFSHRPWSSLCKAFAPNSGWLWMLPYSIVTVLSLFGYGYYLQHPFPGVFAKLIYGFIL